MVTYKYARLNEDRVNAALAEGNIALAQAYANNVTGGGQGVQNAQARMAAAIGAAQDNARRVAESEVAGQGLRPAEVPINPQPAPSGLSASDVQALIDRALAAEREAETRRRNQQAKAYLEDLFSQYGGMQELVGQIDQLIRDYGNVPEVLVGRIRETSTYKNRFKGLVSLRQQGVTDIRNEEEYLNLEREYRSIFREAGMANFLGADGTQTQFDAIAELVADYSVSANEVRQRVNDAARVVADTSPEVRDALESFYGITADVLTEYVLDPQRTMNKVNEIANATLIGGGAARQGLRIDRQAAESASSLAADGDVNMGQFQREFVAAAELRDTTARLASIEGSELTDSESFLASLNLDANAVSEVRGLRSRERARFSGSAGITSSSLQTSRY